MSARRAPVEPPRDVKATLKAALASSQTVVYQGISLMPPTETRATWRIKGTTAGKSVELSGGRDIATAWAACLAVHEQLSALREPAPAGPVNADRTVNELLNAYFRNRGPNQKWKGHTVADRRRDFRKLRTVAGEVKCRDLTKQHISEYLQQGAGTPIRCRTFRSITGTLLEFGRSNDYLTAEQARFHKDAVWPAPKEQGQDDSDEPQVEVERLSRRDQAKAYGGGNVMTHSQVTDFASACASRYVHGEALIHVAANLGLRSAELRLLSADHALGSSQVNFVNTKSWMAIVNFQVSGTSGQKSDLPKSTKQREVVIPAKSSIGTGFDLRKWLAKRCKDALSEQARGENPKALLFPTQTGQVWDANNLRNDVWGPAADDLGWRMPAYATEFGKERTMMRFTLHSLRDRYATTAINEWKYTEEQLLQQGSWEDSETVRKFYAGVTDDTLRSVRRLHGLK